jgi:hypothetical protein
MNQTTELAVIRFDNRNGATSWRATGYFCGERVRRNFKTREEAAAEKATLELKALQTAGGLRAATTLLTDEQLREAESVFRRLTGRPHSLSTFVDYALANFREPARDVPLATAVVDYVATKEKQYAQTLLSKRQLRSIKYELGTFKNHFPKTTLAQFSATSLLAYLERGTPSLKTYNNRRGVLSTFFKFVFRKEWIAANPIEKLRIIAFVIAAARLRRLPPSSQPSSWRMWRPSGRAYSCLTLRCASLRASVLVCFAAKSRACSRRWFASMLG